MRGRVQASNAAVHGIDFGDRLPRESLLHRQQSAALVEREDVETADVPDAVHVSERVDIIW